MKREKHEELGNPPARQHDSKRPAGGVASGDNDLMDTVVPGGSKDREWE